MVGIGSEGDVYESWGWSDPLISRIAISQGLKEGSVSGEREGQRGKERGREIRKRKRGGEGETHIELPNIILCNTVPSVCLVDPDLTLSSHVMKSLFGMNTSLKRCCPSLPQSALIPDADDSDL